MIMIIKKIYNNNHNNNNNVSFKYNMPVQQGSKKLFLQSNVLHVLRLFQFLIGILTPLVHEHGFIYYNVIFQQLFQLCINLHCAHDHLAIHIS